MYTYDAVRRVHLELTTRCNASCPQCPRNIDGGPVNPALNLTELSLADVQTMLPPAFLQQLERIIFCGNYGDPSMARELPEICAYLRESSPQTFLSMNTNGSARRPEWWAQLAGLVDECVFSIDGLEDTNHLYRQNTVWAHIMANAQAFLAAGGHARWDFLIFEHNQHQVEEAAALAQSMGFNDFQAKASGRFLKDHRLLDSVPVHNQQGELVHILRAPTRRRFRNPTSVRLAATYRSPESYEHYLSTTPIDCSAARNAEIFIAAEGLVMPCCWMAQLVPQGTMSQRKQQMHDLIASLPEGRNSLDARLRPMREILDGRFFQHDVPAGWEQSEQRLRVCAKFCGTHGVSSQQFVEHDQSPLRLLKKVVERLIRSHREQLSMPEHPSITMQTIAPCVHTSSGRDRRPA